MMDPAMAYFLKKYYPHVIKWWLVLYNPEVIRIWPSKKEEEEALRLEAEEQALLEDHGADSDSSDMEVQLNDPDSIDDSAFNAATGSYSGLYGKKPVDADTQSALDAILNTSSNQNTVDFLLSGGKPTTTAAYAMSKNEPDNTGDVVLPPEQDEIIREANAIYERLLQEAAEDEAKKIEELRRVYEEAQA